MATIIDRNYNIICPICLDEFDDPVIIECHHSFCRNCIESLINQTSNIQRDQDGALQYSLTRQFNCPSCKSVNKIPRKGVAGFPKSFYIEQLKDAKAQLQSPYPMCAKHKTEDLRFYCTKCETVIYRDCKVLKHEGHTAECVSDVASHMRAELRKNIIIADADLKKLYEAKNICTFDKKKIILMKKSARNMLKNQALEIRRIIDNIEGMLDQDICSFFQTYEDEIDKETSEVDYKADELQDFQNIVLQEIEGGSDHSVINEYKGLLEHRGLIVVADHEQPNPDYKSELANVFCKGNINVTEIQCMLGTVAEMAKELPKSISEEELSETLTDSLDFETEDKIETMMEYCP